MFYWHIKIKHIGGVLMHVYIAKYSNQDEYYVLCYYVLDL